MADTPDSEQFTLSYQNVKEKSADSGFLRFLTYLVFEGHGMRVGLELSLCVATYTLASTLVPWQELGVPPRWSTLISWFGCCFLIILFDQLVLCRSVYTFRKAYLFSVHGAYERALESLEEIGPKSNAFIKLPKALYHLHRAEVLIHSESYKQAETELHLAEVSGIDPEVLYILRSRFYRAKGDIEAAQQELDAGKVHKGETPSLLLEEGIQELESKGERWKAKRALSKVLELPDAAHFAGESCHQLASAYLNACRLWTGEAEEGFDGITRSIDRLRSSVLYVDTLRPILAFLMLERAYYLATHKEPRAAVVDMKLALAYCTFPPFITRGEDIREELAWRHELIVP